MSKNILINDKNGIFVNSSLVTTNITTKPGMTLWFKRIYYLYIIISKR